MVLKSFHSLNLDHETREFEEVIVIEILCVRKWAILDLNEDFVDQSIICIVKHVIDVIPYDSKKLSVTIFERSFINNQLICNNFV